MALLGTLLVAAHHPQSIGGGSNRTAAAAEGREKELILGAKMREFGGKCSRKYIEDITPKLA
jgi:hypothetical protein